MTVEGFYFRMPPYGFLLMIHLAVAIRVTVVAKFGSVNTRTSADIMESAHVESTSGQGAWPKPVGLPQAL